MQKRVCIVVNSSLYHYRHVIHCMGNSSHLCNIIRALYEVVLLGSYPLPKVGTLTEILYYTFTCGTSGPCIRLFLT